MVNRLTPIIEVTARKNVDVTGTKALELVPLFISQITEIVCPTVLINQTEASLTTTWLSWLRLNMDGVEWNTVKKNAVFMLTPHPPKVENKKVIQLWT